jgi:ABC-type transport system involved in cytochrome bd biosynthesis fused ATPase/permease subunit
MDRFRVDDVSVVYDDGTAAIANVSLEIGKGELVIVTGPIASGKSTLLRVLAGLCPPTEGTLQWSGQALEHPSEFLRPPNCSFVHQAPAIISGTVADNVSLDHDLDVDAALRIAELERDLRPVGGSAAVVGHRGLRLSGGQTQRLATARATAAGSELLVLDDLSSALDVDTEQHLWHNLRSTGHTVVATSYKRAALELADQIVVMRGGRVVARGRLDEVDREHGHLFA